MNLSKGTNFTPALVFLLITLKMSRTTFDQIIESQTPTLIDFSAEWCGPCKMLAPVLKQLKQEMGSSIRIVKIDVDKNPALSSRYQIQGVPTMMLWQNGKMLWRQSGLMPVHQLRVAIENAMATA
jgi:thioredoxin 1